MTDYETVEDRVKRAASRLLIEDLAREAVCFLDEMTDDELETLAYTDRTAWPGDFSHKWSAQIDQTESILRQADQAGVVIDEL